MATKRMQLAQSVRALSDADFHELCDRLMPLLNSEYEAIQPYGRLTSAAKSRRGQPDPYVMRASGRFIAFQYTTIQSATSQKLEDDVLVLADAQKCRIHDRIEKVVICCASEIDPDVMANCRKAARDNAWGFKAYSLDNLCAGLEVHPEVGEGLINYAHALVGGLQVALLSVSFGSPSRSNCMPSPPRFRARLRFRNAGDSPFRVTNVRVPKYEVNTDLLTEPLGHVWWHEGKDLRKRELDIGPRTIKEVELDIRVNFTANTPRGVAEKMSGLSDFGLMLALEVVSPAGAEEPLMVELTGSFEDFIRAIVDDYWAKGLAPALAKIARGRPPE